MGQPLGSPSEVKFTHTVQFRDDGIATDNASTFFGNPPETGKYKVEGNVVTLDLRGVTGRSYRQKYVLSDDGLTITGEAGAVLTLKN